jgi:hypothetical protein
MQLLPSQIRFIHVPNEKRVPLQTRNVMRRPDSLIYRVRVPESLVAGIPTR